MTKTFSALAVAAVMSSTINRQSLWTDEAFSAYLACHRSFASCWSTLLHGDSSDLQMVLYYLYLHGWCQIFGQSEIAFRTANVPFILLYAAVLVWASSRLFHSNWVWGIAALAPLAVEFASDARPYFDVIALSLTCVTCLLAYLQSPSQRERKVLPWLILVSLLLGALFHMLMLLLGPPLAVLAVVFSWQNRQTLHGRDWKRPLIVLSPLFGALMVYFVWTFGRGVAYEYAHPDFLSMGSVLFRFLGLSGYAPNRRYDIPFRPYLGAMALSTTVFLTSLAALYFHSSRSFKALCAALGAGIAQIFLLSFATRQQIEFRHLSSLLPLLMLLIMAGLAQTSKIKLSAAAALGITWLIADVRTMASPDYQREDFRSAVTTCLKLQDSERQHGNNAVIAVASDPLGAAYYGLSMEGPAPCFPLVDSCQEGLSKVNWPDKASAPYALFWSEAQIRDWLQNQTRAHSKVILLISRSRHPMMTKSAWWPLIHDKGPMKVYPQFGFLVYQLQ